MNTLKKYVFYICFFSVIAVFSYLIVNKKETNATNQHLDSQGLKQEESVIDEKVYKVSALNAQAPSKNDQNATGKNAFITPVNFSEIMKKGAKNNGVVYISLSDLDPVSRKGAEEAIRNLNEKGSLSGGIKSSEFSELEKARENLQQEGIQKITSQLDGFLSTNDQILNDHGLKLTGAQNFGRYDSENGWNSIYKLYEDSNQKVEIEQSYLKPNESAHQFIIESLNYELNQNTPARYEKLPSDLIEKLTFVNDGHYYQINGQNLKPNQLQEIAKKIIESKNK
jgi:hypothetical protein